MTTGIFTPDMFTKLNILNIHVRHKRQGERG